MAETGQYYKRPVEGFRFTEQGLKTNVTPDAIPPNRSPYCQNIRGYSPTSVRVRPGLKAIWQTVGSVLPITDIGSYAALNTDDAPFYLVRNSADQVFSLAGANVGSLAGGGSSPGASMIPFRPAQSDVRTGEFAEGGRSAFIPLQFPRGRVKQTHRHPV